MAKGYVTITRELLENLLLAPKGMKFGPIIFLDNIDGASRYRIDIEHPSVKRGQELSPTFTLDLNAKDPRDRLRADWFGGQ